jgi:hypothetical protein
MHCSGSYQTNAKIASVTRSVKEGRASRRRERESELNLCAHIKFLISLLQKLRLRLCRGKTSGSPAASIYNCRLCVDVSLVPANLLFRDWAPESSGAPL